MEKEEVKEGCGNNFSLNHIGTEFRAVKTEGKKRKFFLSWVGRYFARYQSCLLSSFPSFSYMDGSLILSLWQVKFPFFGSSERNFSAWKKGWMEVYLMVVT